MRIVSQRNHIGYYDASFWYYEVIALEDENEIVVVDDYVTIANADELNVIRTYSHNIVSFKTDDHNKITDSVKHEMIYKLWSMLVERKKYCIKTLSIEENFTQNYKEPLTKELESIERMLKWMDFKVMLRTPKLERVLN